MFNVVEHDRVTEQYQQQAAVFAAAAPRVRPPSCIVSPSKRPWSAPTGECSSSLSARSWSAPTDEVSNQRLSIDGCAPRADGRVRLPAAWCERAVLRGAAVGAAAGARVLESGEALAPGRRAAGAPLARRDPWADSWEVREGVRRVSGVTLRWRRLRCSALECSQRSALLGRAGAHRPAWRGLGLRLQSSVCWSAQKPSSVEQCTQR